MSEDRRGEPCFYHETTSKDIQNMSKDVSGLKENLKKLSDWSIQDHERQRMADIVMSEVKTELKNIKDSIQKLTLLVSDNYTKKSEVDKITSQIDKRIEVLEERIDKYKESCKAYTLKLVGMILTIGFAVIGVLQWAIGFMAH